jgi:uncharacterized protein (DUF983 family)
MVAGAPQGKSILQHSLRSASMVAALVILIVAFVAISAVYLNALWNLQRWTATTLLALCPAWQESSSIAVLYCVLNARLAPADKRRRTKITSS